MKVRDVATVLFVAASSLGAATPSRVRLPAGTLRPLYGSAVHVESFRLDRDPVTRAELARWRAGKGAAMPAVENPRAPATDVTWGEARNYCVARGGRLPTVAEWEYVAAASRGARDATSNAAFVQELVAVYATRANSRRVVDSAQVNAYGVRGMHDLVWEWVADPNPELAAQHHATMHHEHGAARHDMSCAGAAIGAADPRNYPAFLRAAFRSGLTESTRLPTLGFRCAY